MAKLGPLFFDDGRLARCFPQDDVLFRSGHCDTPFFLRRSINGGG